MNIADAQRDMRFAYYGGAPGMFTSGMVWLIAGFVALLQTPERAVWALFIGAMFIHPVGILLVRALGRSGSHKPGNPMAALALATTFWLVLSCALAYVVSLYRIEWFFPAMLFVIGGRYLCFSTMYGGRIYWACGAALIIAGYGLAQAQATPTLGAFTGAAIEAVFAIAIFLPARKEFVVQA